MKRKRKENEEKILQIKDFYDSILTRDILIPCSAFCGARDQKEVTGMNKYELAVVVSAKIEDDERAATIEKVKGYIERFGGTITNVDEWGKKKLAYDIQKMSEAFYYFIQFDADATVPYDVENHVRLMENVIRFLCVRQDEA